MRYFYMQNVYANKCPRTECVASYNVEIQEKLSDYMPFKTTVDREIFVLKILHVFKRFSALTCRGFVRSRKYFNWLPVLHVENKNLFERVCCVGDRHVYSKAIPTGSLVSGPPPALKLRFPDLGYYS